MQVVASVDTENCANRGPVVVNFPMFGFASESLNILRNKTGKLGANTLAQTSTSTGVAYRCAEIQTLTSESDLLDEDLVVF